MMRDTIHIIFCVLIILSVSCIGRVTSKHKLGETINDSSANRNINKITEQTNNAVEGNDGLTSIYSQAISDYITAVSRQHLIAFDTLFFGKRKNGQPDDFPDIILPATINNYPIRLIDPAVGKKQQEEKKSNVYINLVGWVEKDKAEFMFVTFSNGFEHQFDFHIYYTYNLVHKMFELTKSRTEIVSKK